MAAPRDDEHATLPADAGLHRVELSAANEMGTVNAWIVDDEPLTLVDAGTNVPGSLETLEAALGAVGRRVQDVGLVVLTHHHTDHLGLVATVARRSGAEVAALAPIAPYLQDLPAETALDRAYFEVALRRHGAGEDRVAATLDVWERFHRVADAAAVTVPLEPGSRIELRDRTLEVLHRPGHSETDVLLVDAERRLALGGDHLLRAGPSVPVRDRPLPAGDGAAAATRLVDRAGGGGDGPASPAVVRAAAIAHDLGSLVRYRASLRATAELDVDVVLPGHRRAFGDPAAVVAAHLARQERDAASLLRRLPDAPTTAVELLAAVWPEAPPGFTHVLLSGVLGTLGLLHAEGRVAVVDDGPAGGPVRFAAT